MRRRGRRHEGRGRQTVRMVEPTLLLLLHYRPTHGYTLLEQMRQFGLGDLNSSMVYRALRDMEQAKWVTSTWDEAQTQGPPRRVYRLTELGDEMLNQYTQELQEARGMIDYLLGAYSRHMEEGSGEHH